MPINEIIIGLDGITYFPYNQIKVNNRIYLLRYRQLKEKIYISENHSIEDNENIFYLCGVVKDNSVLSNFLPSKIFVNGQPFIRRVEYFFTPSNPTSQDIVKFFDFIAPNYKNLIDIDLNKALISKFFDLSRKIINKNCYTYKLLDFGTGIGLSFDIYKRKKKEFSRHCKLYGCDISQEMISICKEKAFDKAFLSKYANVNFPSNYFNVIISTFVTQYFIDERPFDEMLRLLKDGGIIIFNLFKPIYEYKYQYRTLLSFKKFRNIRFVERTIQTKEKNRKIPIVIAQK